MKRVSTKDRGAIGSFEMTVTVRPSQIFFGVLPPPNHVFSHERRNFRLATERRRLSSHHSLSQLFDTTTIRTTTMDDTDTAFEESTGVQNALAHHNEWKGHNIEISVNESPELDELVDIDLAECIGKSNGARIRHTNTSRLVAGGMVRHFMERHYSTLTFRHSDIAIFRLNSVLLVSKGL